jgi:hypothetical protein
VTDIIWVKFPMWDYFIIGLITSFLAVISDLLESFIKRCAGVKVIILFLWKMRSNFVIVLGLKLYLARSWWILRQSRLTAVTIALPTLVHLHIPALHTKPRRTHGTLRFRHFPRTRKCKRYASSFLKITKCIIIQITNCIHLQNDV